MFVEHEELVLEFGFRSIKSKALLGRKICEYVCSMLSNVDS